MDSIDTYTNELALAWNTKLAKTSLERWFDVCNKEHWQYDENLNPLLISVFGSSWYFTRFIFYRGDKIFPILNSRELDFEHESISKYFSNIDVGQDIEKQFEQLRIKKNEIMLRILVAYLSNRIDQKKTEYALTKLAETTFNKAIEIYFPKPESYKNVIVLAMGRMAGNEMTFGSDLDMVFLSFGQLDDRFYKLGKQIMGCIRKISYPSSEGMLYEVDTRLRPHGNSGTLITRYQAFHDYHLKERETWEKQMMTRCRVIFGNKERLADHGFDQIYEAIYNIKDKNFLSQQIVDMRMTVEQQLGSPFGKFDMKKGKGGIMDIDFISHFLQLTHGQKDHDLRTASTREALMISANKAYLKAETSKTLIEHYDFLKKLETHLRLFDMKAIDVIENNPEKNTHLSRSMGFGIADDKRTEMDFLQEYKQHTEAVRNTFHQILNSTQ